MKMNKSSILFAAVLMTTAQTATAQGTRTGDDPITGVTFMSSGDVGSTLNAVIAPTAGLGEGPTRAAKDKSTAFRATSATDILGQVSPCFNAPTQWSRPSVTLSVTLDGSGQPIRETIHLVSAKGGGNDAVFALYAAARDAIVGCGADGFEVASARQGEPVEFELTFDAEESN